MMTPQTQQFIGQALGILATIITVISYQMNTKKSLLLVQTAATTCTCLAYFFLGAASGFALNVVCIIRNIVFYFQKDSGKVHTISSLLLAGAMVVLGALSWQGPMSLLVIIALAANTLFLSFPNIQNLRKSILVTSTMVLIYNAYYSVWGGVVNEMVVIVSSAIGLYRYKNNIHQAKCF